MNGHYPLYLCSNLQSFHWYHLCHHHNVWNLLWRGFSSFMFQADILVAQYTIKEKSNSKKEVQNITSLLISEELWREATDHGDHFFKFPCVSPLLSFSQTYLTLPRKLLSHSSSPHASHPSLSFSLCSNFVTNSVLQAFLSKVAKRVWNPHVVPQYWT